MAFSQENQLFAGDFHPLLNEINAGMLQFTKKWNWKWIFQHHRYFCKRLPTTTISFAPKYVCIFKAGLSSLSDGWAKCKEKVPSVSDSNQNVEITCNYKLRFIELKDLFITEGAEKLAKDELCNTAINSRTSNFQRKISHQIVGFCCDW